MPVNEAMWDRIVRLVLGAVLAYLGFFNMSGAGGTILGIIGIILIITGITGFCLLYRVLGISTRKEA